MDKLVASPDDIMATLEDLLRIYRRLEDTARAKRHALGEGDLKALQTLLQEEQQLIQNVEQLEKQRAACDKENGAFPLTLSAAIAALEGELQKKARILYTELKDTVKSVAILNKTNSEVIEHLLRFIDYNVNLLSDNNSAPSGYGRTGDDNQLPRRLIDRKA